MQYDDRAPRNIVESAKANYAHLSVTQLRLIAEGNRVKASGLPWNVDLERTITATSVACEELAQEKSATTREP